MIATDLFNAILISPAQKNADELYIVSGYASAAFVARHLSITLETKQCPRVKLIVGMFPDIANLSANLNGFQRLSSTDFPVTFECRYAVNLRVHAKAYCWYKGGIPFQGFVGSANYTNNGFNRTDQEIMEESNVAELRQYFDNLWELSTDCREPSINQIVHEVSMATIEPVIRVVPGNQPPPELPHVTLSLLTVLGEIHNKGGLNWGQRERRESNQAYILLRQQ